MGLHNDIMFVADSPCRQPTRCVLVLATTAALSVLAVSAHAQPITGHAPWCVNVPFHGGNRDCAYYTLEQCMESARGVSNQCERNPWYEPPPLRSSKRRYHR